MNPDEMRESLKASPDVPSDELKEQLDSLEAKTKEATSDGAVPGGYVSQAEYDALASKYDVAMSRIEELEEARQKSDAAPVGLTHTVKKVRRPGDPEDAPLKLERVRDIAKEYGVTLSQIERLNPQSNIRYLVVGQELRIK